MHTAAASFLSARCGRVLHDTKWHHWSSFPGPSRGVAQRVSARGARAGPGHAPGAPHRCQGLGDRLRGARARRLAPGRDPDQRRARPALPRGPCQEPLRRAHVHHAQPAVRAAGIGMGLGAPPRSTAAACVGAESAERPAAWELTAWTRTLRLACRLVLGWSVRNITVDSSAYLQCNILLGGLLRELADHSLGQCACMVTRASSLAQAPLTPGAA